MASRARRTGLTLEFHAPSSVHAARLVFAAERLHISLVALSPVGASRQWGPFDQELARLRRRDTIQRRRRKSSARHTGKEKA